MSRRTEDEQACDLLADIQSRGFRLCESVPKADRHYLDGSDPREWSSIDDRRAIRLLALLLLEIL